ncbi:hypothetical protein MBT84_23550 [Streptomyces sp. MBT84]|nr:hypothetical protein [Streptomyces sp. MBT84]
MGVPEVAAEFAGAVQQNGLQVVLAAQAPGGGAQPGESAVRVDVPEQPCAGVAEK